MSLAVFIEKNMMSGMTEEQVEKAVKKMVEGLGDESDAVFEEMLLNCKGDNINKSISVESKLKLPKDPKPMMIKEHFWKTEIDKEKRVD